MASSASGVTLRLFLLGACAGLLAGCANSERLSDGFNDPFRGDIDRTPTASISQPAPYYAPPAQSYAPARPVESRPLSPPPGAYTSHPVVSYSAPAYSSSHLASRSWSGSDTQTVKLHQSAAGWTAEGGIPIVVAQGETAELIARRYGVPTDALVHANGYNFAGQIRPGARIVIPTYNAAMAASSGVRFSAAREQEARAQERMHDMRMHEAQTHEVHLHFVRGPEPAAMRDRHEAKLETRKLEARERAVHEKIALHEKHKMREEATTARVVREHESHEAVAASAPHVLTHEARAAAPVDRMPTASFEEPHAQTASVAESGSPGFRWPARGRITEGYRRGVNDGINIALPEGTAVKAAEAGTVVYAGNEVRGYGNLVLIRHPNGYVTAYANNSQISVKRGEAVRRGQVIAESGETGNATSPQLHFEVRKGATPVDPTQFLAGL